MKLMNTNDLRRLLEEGIMELPDPFEEHDETAGPCREIKIDREAGKVIFFVDRREIMSQDLDKTACGFSMEEINALMAMWRSGKMDELRRHLCLGEME